MGKEEWEFPRPLSSPQAQPAGGEDSRGAYPVVAGPGEDPGWGLGKPEFETGSGRPWARPGLGL